MSLGIPIEPASILVQGLLTFLLMVSKPLGMPPSTGRSQPLGARPLPPSAFPAPESPWREIGRSGLWVDEKKGQVRRSKDLKSQKLLCGRKWWLDRGAWKQGRSHPEKKLVTWPQGVVLPL